MCFLVQYIELFLLIFSNNYGYQHYKGTAHISNGISPIILVVYVKLIKNKIFYKHIQSIPGVNATIMPKVMNITIAL